MIMMIMAKRELAKDFKMQMFWGERSPPEGECVYNNSDSIVYTKKQQMAMVAMVDGGGGIGGTRRMVCGVVVEAGPDVNSPSDLANKSALFRSASTRKPHEIG